MAAHPLNATWHSMIRRCHDPEHPSYFDYGARGITVCDRWRESFVRFVVDMGPKPTPTHSLDRINNDGDYEPGNVRWATRAEQRANQRPRCSLRVLQRHLSAIEKRRAHKP